MTPPIAILGAGPSGLCLARLLQTSRIAYTIFEKDQSATWAAGRGGSGTLDIHVNDGQHALRRAGLTDQFKARCRSNASTVIADSKGKSVVRLCGEGEDERPEIDRKDLRDMLLNSVPADKIQWGRRVQQVQRATDGLMSVDFTDGSSASGFRLVVGADGAWSKARELVTPFKPQYAGKYYLSTSIKPENKYHSAAAALAGNGNYMACGGGKAVMCMLLGDESYYLAVALQLPEQWKADNSSLLENPSKLRQVLVQDYFADWPKTLTDLIKHSEGPFRPWPLYTISPNAFPWQTVPGVALIGDAAHLTTPNGDGVNIGLYDSLQLAEQIIEHGVDDLDSAVSEYEKLMLPRAIDLSKPTAQDGDLMFAPDAPYGWLQKMGIPEGMGLD